MNKESGNVKKVSNILIIIILFIVILLFLCWVPIKQENSIKIIYSGLPNEENGLSINTTGKINLECNNDIVELPGTINEKAHSFYEITYELGDPGKDISNLSFELQYDSSQSYVKAIEIYNRMTQVRHFAPVEIVEYFDCGINESFYFEGPCVVFVTKDESPTLIGNERLQQELPQILQNDMAIRVNMVICYIIVFASCIGLYAKKYRKELRKKYTFKHINYELKNYIGVFFLIIIQLMIFIMAIRSKLYAHPDETVTRVAIDYYLGNWLKPSGESNWVAGTFSPAGYSRLFEDTWYYLAAGKIGWLVSVLTHSATYFRILNVILFSIMAGIAIKYGKKEKWLYFVLLFTPQLWYVFSYATSDAWDFFWGFIITYELILQESSLNNFLEGKRKRSVLWLGFIFSNIFLAKQNYYCVLLFAFIVLLFRLFSMSGKKLVLQIRRYCEILASTGVFYFIKKFLDYILSNIEQNKLFFVERAYTGKALSLFETGYSIKDLFIGKDLGKALFGSFIGAYGWMAHWNNEIHTYIVAFLYGTVICVLLTLTHQMNWKEKFEIFFLLGVCILMFLMVVIHCWMSDYQPQGRYMLPVIFILGYISTKAKEKWQASLLSVLMLMIGITSIISFSYVGLRALVL